MDVPGSSVGTASCPPRLFQGRLTPVRTLQADSSEDRWCATMDEEPAATGPERPVSGPGGGAHAQSWHQPAKKAVAPY